MSDPPSYDNDLLSRLNKLKKTNISFDQTNNGVAKASSPAPENDLSHRLRSLRNASASPTQSPISKPSQSTSQNPTTETALFPAVPSRIKVEDDPIRQPVDIDDKTLDELLADLGPDDQWKLDPDDPENIQRLLNEAKTASAKDDITTQHSDPKSGKPGIHSSKHNNGKTEWTGDSLSKDIDFSVFRNSDDEDDDKANADKGVKQKEDDQSKKREEEEDLEADEIVRRMLEEVSLEKTISPARESSPAPTSPSKGAVDSDTNDTFALPSAPTNDPPPSEDPQSSKRSLDFESDISARMAALKGLTTNNLGLPSAPSFKPADRPVKGLSKKPDYTDEEIDSWCVICQDDATVRCLGCDGDLYCANCWKEGHMGPDAGYDEKMHKWAKYKKPR